LEKTVDEDEKNLFDISLNGLEEACQANPRITFDWCKRLAEAKRDAKIAKSKLKLTEAELMLDVKKRPEAYGLEKPPMDVVNAAVVSCAAYREADKNLIQKEFDRDEIEAVVDALSDKKEQLSNLVKLHGQGYFSKVEVDTETAERIRRKEAREDSERQQSSQEEARKRRKK